MATQPSAAATAGQPFAQQPAVLIADAFNNARSNDTLTVTATRSSGRGRCWGQPTWPQSMASPHTPT